MFRKELIIRSNPIGRIFNSYFSSNIQNIDIKKLEKESTLPEVYDDDETKAKEEQIQRSRNKSRLKEQDRRFLFDQNPYPETLETMWYQGTLKYKRKMYGRYGKDSGIDPALCWPTTEELKDAKEYERVAYPYTIPEMIKAAQEKHSIKIAETQKRQQDMLIKLSKVEGWKKDMEQRIAKKEAEANAAKLKKERLIEEVRKHFGYKVDPKDDKFKELLEKKEKEQRKLAKEERKKEKEAKLMEKLKSKKKEKKASKDDATENDVDNEEKKSD